MEVDWVLFSLPCIALVTTRATTGVQARGIHFSFDILVQDAGTDGSCTNPSGHGKPWLRTDAFKPGLFSLGFVRTFKFVNLHKLLRTLKRRIRELYYEETTFWGKNAPKSAPFTPKTTQFILIIYLIIFGEFQYKLAWGSACSLGLAADTVQAAFHELHSSVPSSSLSPLLATSFPLIFLPLIPPPTSDNFWGKFGGKFWAKWAKFRNLHIGSD